MKRILCIIAALALTLTVFAQGQDCFPSSKGEKPFLPDEKITFSVMYRWGAVYTEVGLAFLECTQEVLEGEPVYRSHFWVKSAPFFDLFFKMREDFNSWFTVSDLQPRKFTRDTYEGGYTADNLYLYDWNAGLIHADVCFNNQPRQIMEIPLQGCVQDILSLVANLRTLDLDAMRPGDSLPLRFAIDDMVYDIFFKYHGLEKRKVRRKGTMLTHHCSVSVVTGAMFEGDADVEMWFSTDGNQIPVAAMAPLRWGAVWAWVKQYDNPKYPFPVLVK